MKKLLCLIGLLGLVPSAQAENSHLYIIPPDRGTSVGMFNLYVGAKLANDQVESAPAFQAEFLKRTSPNAAFGFGLGYSHAKNKTDMLTEGTLDMIPFLAKARLYIDSADTGTYLEAGVGEYFFNHKLDSEVTDFFDAYGLTAKETVENTFGGYLGFGFNFLNKADTSLGINAQHHFIRPKVEATLTDQATGITLSNTESISLNTTIISIVFTKRY